ncbi:MAG TPA: hypothetical protein VIV58_20205 [Kofleriaceae bacterium]
MRSSALVAAAALACAACNGADESPMSEAETETVAPPPAPERIPVGVPHGGFINHVAVTEQGDAAVSLDNIGGLRLWPALDGSREPVPFSVNGAAAIAISHAGKELLVGVLDEAGAVQLLRFSRTGVLHGRTQLPGEVAVDELVAIDAGMLVVRTDEAIERYDETGTLRGRIAAEPGESLGALATRHGSAAVILVERHLEAPSPVLEEEIPDRRKPRRTVMVPRGRAAAMRWIVLADAGLRWGASIALPDKLDERELAISPSHERIALISQASELVVLDVTKTPVPVDVPKASVGAGSAIGFVDDDRVVRMSGSTHWWISTHAGKSAKVADPWHVDNGIGDESINGDGAAADGVVVSGTGPDLVLQDVHDTKYLGWRQLASGALIQAGSHLGVVTTMSNVIWLDRALQRESEVALEDYGFSARDRSWWLDPNHAVVMGTGDKPALSLVDFRHRDKPVALGSYTYVQRVDYDETTHQLAVLDDRVVRRFTVDLERDQIAELQALDLTFQASMLIQFDPARSGGAVAIAWGYDDDGDRMATFREADAKPGKHLKAKKRRLDTGSYVGYSPDGTIYMHDGNGVFAMRDGKTVRRFPKGELADSLVADKTGERLVGIHGAAVTLYDAAGTKLWAQNVWGAQGIVFAADGSIVVRTTGGLIELDPATGARVAAACGFAFGVMTKTPQINTFNTQPVCEDLGT